jgi:hypothetical protein
MKLVSMLYDDDRGTDAMHLANTPVVSPESKKPKGNPVSNFAVSSL